MPITECKNCGQEFSTPGPDELIGRIEPVVCPGCGAEWTLASEAKAPARSAPRRRGRMSLRLAGGVVAVVSLAIGAAGGVAAGRLFTTPTLPDGLLAAAMGQFVALNIFALASAGRRLGRAVALLRLGALGLLVVGGAAIADGARRPWPGDWPSEPTGWLLAAMIALVVALGYLAAIETFAQKLHPGLDDTTPVAPPNLTLWGLVFALLSLGAAGAAGMAAIALMSYRAGELGAAILAGLAAGALGVYCVWTGGALAGYRKQPASAAKSLSQAVGPATVAWVLILVGREGGWMLTWLDTWAWAMILGMWLVAVAVLHWAIRPKAIDTP